MSRRATYQYGSYLDRVEDGRLAFGIDMEFQMTPGAEAPAEMNTWFPDKNALWLAENWYTRQYYGTVAHNSKAVYQKYMGWYDANPVNLHPLTPEESAKKWVEYAQYTTVDGMLRQAKVDFDQGEFQWVAEVSNTIVFADPENMVARYLCADALEQLGYQAESGAWRNAYLSAALELREGNQSANAIDATSSDMLLNMTTSMVLDYMGILLNKSAVGEDDFSINLQVTDTGEQWMLRLKHGALLKYENYQSDTADLTISTPHQGLFLLLTQDSERFQSMADITGDVTYLEKLIDNLNEFSISESSAFHIIEP